MLPDTSKEVGEACGKHMRRLMEGVVKTRFREASEETCCNLLVMFCSAQFKPEVFLRIAAVEQFYQVKRIIRGIRGALSSTYSQTLG